MTVLANSNSLLLLSEAKTSQGAAHSCAALEEHLLPVDNSFFESQVVPALQYQVYQRLHGESQRFWIASNEQRCQTVNVRGEVSAAECAESLPALCTQSAVAGAAASTANMISVKSNKLTIIGYVRCFKFQASKLIIML